MNAKEFIKALDNLAEEKKISKDEIYDAMELALLTAYKKNFNSLTNARIDINKDTGEIKIYTVYNVVEDYDDLDLDTEISLEEARKKVKDIQVGETIEEEVTPKDFGRVAASTAKQVIIQKVKEAEKISLMNEFEDKQDELIVGIVSMEDENNYLIDLGRTMGILPKKELIGDEKIKMGSSIKAYVTKVSVSSKSISILFI